MMWNLLPNRVVHLVNRSEKCNASCGECEKSETKVCFVLLYDVEKPTNDTVEQLCPIIVRVTNLSQPAMCCGDKNSDKNACQCAVHEIAEKHACGMVFIYTFLAQIVKRSFNITLSVSRSWLRSKWGERVCTGHSVCISLPSL